MITLLVAVITVVLAIPSFERFTRNNLLATSANDFAASLSRARAEAIKSRRNVRVCPTSNFSSCSTSVGWDDGWIMFVDIDGDGLPAASELLQARTALDSRVSLTAPASFSQWLQFRPTGGVIGNGGSAGTFTVCSGDYEDYSRLVAVSTSGRVTTKMQADLCASS